MVLSVSLFSTFVFSQVAIGKDTVDGDGILDFSTTNQGISLPKITSLDAGTVAGTLYFDASDTKVKAKLASSTLDLSVKGAATENLFDATADGYDALVEEVTVNGTVIGAESSSVVGALVLASPTADGVAAKSLILPKVANPHTTIPSPEPGMIAYDTTKKMLCVYNGDKWSFWGE